MQMDALDKLAAEAFDGFIVRKDLVRRFKGQYPVPTYVAEFLLGRYCASVDDEEINVGLQVVERQLSQRTVRAGEQELFKARARDRDEIKIIDLIKAKLNDRADCFEAELPSLQLKDVRTLRSRMNRTAVKHCTTMMGKLMPAILLVWIDHGADEDWGIMCYPPVEAAAGSVR